MPSYTLTNDWDGIQERNIDPHSPVTSDNHNKLLKAFGTSKMWAIGLDISFIVDTSEHLIIAQLTKGTVFVQYMVIEFTDFPTIELTGLTPATSEQYIVVDYTYSKIDPPPIATVKLVSPSEYEADHQLILFGVKFGDWTTETTFPSQTTVNNWFTEESGNLIDYRNTGENLPSWATDTYIPIIGGSTPKLEITEAPTGDTDAVNKAYVDGVVGTATNIYDDYFVQKYHDESDETTYGKVANDVDVYKSNPIIGLHDADTNGSGVTVSLTSGSVDIASTKARIDISINGNLVSQINSDGITGAVWNADVAEYFPIDPDDPDMQLKPEPGMCVCVEDGVAHISNAEGDPSCIGFVSYTPAYILGGSVDFNTEFETNHRIPVAIAGQIEAMCVYTNGCEQIMSGAVIVSGLDGRALAVSPYNNPYPITSIIGKALVPVYPGENDHVLVLVKS